MSSSDKDESRECVFPGCGADAEYVCVSVSGLHRRFCGRHARALRGSPFWEVKEL